MVFSSLIFLFIFLPIVLLGYVIMPNVKSQNIWLFVMSIIFYSFGGIQFTVFFLMEILFNWIIGLMLEKNRNKKTRKVLLILGLVVDIGCLAFFKFNSLLMDTINNYFNLSFIKVALPIGISFYTFQEISYIVDVYRGKKCQKGIIELGLYLTFFPQLIAGPIIRYEDIRKELSKRVKSFDNIFNGFNRFCIGLVKKVLIANQLGVFVDYIFASNLENISAEILWLGALSYTFQIFFDFSGYSDMAIGLGKMFGFYFKENFNYPYLSKTFTEFWKRWHISLSNWFKDYVYIPLGGNKKSKFKTIRNILIAWFLTGIWHGASLNFILWGIIWGLLIIMEKCLLLKNNHSSCIKKIYSFFVMIIIMLLWILFRSKSIIVAFHYITRMFSIDAWIMNDMQFKFFALSIHELYIYFILSLVFIFPIHDYINSKTKTLGRILSITRYIVLFVLTLISISFIISGSYNPFVYFQF